MAFALCAIFAQAACNNTKGTDKGDEPIPMFVQVYDSLNLEMIYWTGFDQPAKDEDNDKYYEDWYNEWFYQDQFRKHKEEYTKILANDQTWNVDDDGMYIPTGINAAFDGPKGLELYYVRTAPESCAVGRYTINKGNLEKRNYSTYYVYYD